MCKKSSLFIIPIFIVLSLCTNYRLEAGEIGRGTLAFDEAAKQERLEGDSAETFAEYSRALATYRRAFAMSRKAKATALVLSNIGYVYGQLAQYESALENLQTALKMQLGVKDTDNASRTLSRLAGVYTLLGKYQTAMEYLHQASDILEDPPYVHYRAFITIRLGDIFYHLGNLENALNAYNQSLIILSGGDKAIAHTAIGNAYRSLSQEDIWIKRGKAVANTAISNLYRSISQEDKALYYLNQALTLQNEINDKAGMAESLSMIGESYSAIAKYPDALEYLRRSLIIQKEIGDKKNEAETLLRIGRCYSGLAQYENAMGYYQQALDIQRNIKVKEGEARTLGAIGILFLDLSDYEKGRQTFSDGLRISSEIGATESIWNCQRGLAEAEAKLGQFEGAVEHYERAIDTLEMLRSGFSDRENQLSFMKNKFVVYEKFIELLQILHRKEPSKGYDRKALEVFERMQGRVILEEIGKSTARRFSDLPEDIREKEFELETFLSTLKTALSSERSRPLDQQAPPDQLLALEERIRKVKADQNALQEMIRTQYPRYYELKYPRPATLSEFREKILGPGEATLVYGVMENITCLWVISKESFTFIPIRIGEKELLDLVNKYRQSIRSILDNRSRIEMAKITSSLREIQDGGMELSNLLLPDEARKIISKAGTLYIVPTGPLYLLPFESLTVVNATDAKKSHYLIEDHPVAYLSSASLLKVLRGAELRESKKAMYPLLAFANPVYRKPSTERPGKSYPASSTGTRGAGEASHISDIRNAVYENLMGGAFNELPETEELVKKIEQILSAPSSSQPLQIREAASRSNVFRLNEEKKLDQYRYLVFACHGVLPGEVDELQQPALVLSHPDPKDQKDGFLTVADVFGLKLNADLVTLSACNTGRGEDPGGRRCHRAHPCLHVRWNSSSMRDPLVRRVRVRNSA